MTKEITATDIDVALRHLLNMALTYESRQLTATEHARLKLALADMSPEVEELVDAIMCSMASELGDCVSVLIESIATDPEGE